MTATRYGFAARGVKGARVLELGCGSGNGVGILLRAGATVTGGDINSPLLSRARTHYGARAGFVRLSAHDLPFSAASFDLVLFLEATYYVPDMDRAVSEITRILRPGGKVRFVNANPERPDFIRSPHSHHYHSADEFRRLLEGSGFEVYTGGAFPLAVPHGGALRELRSLAVRRIRQALERFGLVPTTLAGRARLKRLVMRNLRDLPSEIPDDFAPTSEITELQAGPVPSFKVIYVEARRPNAPA